MGPRQLPMAQMAREHPPNKPARPCLAFFGALWLRAMRRRRFGDVPKASATEPISRDDNSVPDLFICRGLEPR